MKENKFVSKNKLKYKIRDKKAFLSKKIRKKDFSFLNKPLSGQYWNDKLFVNNIPIVNYIDWREEDDFSRRDILEAKEEAILKSINIRKYHLKDDGFEEYSNEIGTCYNSCCLEDYSYGREADIPYNEELSNKVLNSPTELKNKA